MEKCGNPSDDTHMNWPNLIDKMVRHAILNDMVERDESRLDSVFQALSHPARREIVGLLSQRSFNIGEFVPQFDMSFEAVSKHVKVLENAGIIEREIRGRTHICHLNAEALNEAYSWLSGYEKFWSSRLDALKNVLESGGR